MARLSADGRAAYMRAWRARNRGQADPYIHGTQQAYANYGCRCDDCREAHRRGSAANRRARQRLVNAHREEFLRYLTEEQLLGQGEPINEGAR